MKWAKAANTLNTCASKCIFETFNIKNSNNTFSERKLWKPIKSEFANHGKFKILKKNSYIPLKFNQWSIEK